MIDKHSKPHKLIVRVVGEKWDYFKTPNWEDWEIVHNDDCPQETWEDFDGESYTHYTCQVGYESEQVETRWSLHYSGTPIEEPGEYLIGTWHESYHGFDYTEYDGGICLLDENDLKYLQEPDE